MNRLFLFAAALWLAAAGPAAAQERLDGARFFPTRSTLYGPARQLGEALGLEITWQGGSLYLGADKVPQSDQESLPDGTALIKLRALPGATVAWDATARTAEVTREEKRAVVADRVTVTEAITFAADGDGRPYAPVREVSEALGLDYRRDSGELAGKALPQPGVRELLNGTPVLDLARLEGWGASVSVEAGSARAELNDRVLWASKADQRVAISLDRQRMRGWQGRRLIFEVNVSTGRSGHATPKGLYTSGPLKSRLVISRRYDNAPMPWAVQVRGDVMIHGSTSVPRSPASHGCIRVPLTGENPARWFYQWVSLGVPIHIAPGWPTEWPVDMPGRAAKAG